MNRYVVVKTIAVDYHLVELEDSEAPEDAFDVVDAGCHDDIDYEIDEIITDEKVLEQAQGHICVSRTYEL